MPLGAALPETPSTESQAVSWAVVAVLRLCGWLFFLGALIAACVPSRALFLLDAVRRALPERARAALRLVFHAAGALLLYGLSALHVRALVGLLWRAPELARLGAFVCAERPLVDVYSDPDVVRTLSALVVLVHSAQYADRAAAHLIEAPALDLNERLGRALSAGVAWIAAMDASPLASLLVLLVALDMQLHHLCELVDALWPRQIDIADALRRASVAAAGCAALYASWTAHGCAPSRTSAGTLLVACAHILPLATRLLAGAELDADETSKTHTD